MTYNTRSPAVKRLMKEAQELSEPTELFYARPLEDNLFEWHFTIRGPTDTDYDGGIYHGRILLPAEYPMKPPNILLMTPSGRFEINRKICLSISGYHPETWRPSWSIRTALLAIIGFMPTHGVGAIGSLDYPPEERRKLAKSSVDYICPQCGCVKSVLKSLTEASVADANEAKNLAAQISFTGDKAGEKLTETNQSKMEQKETSTQSTNECSPSIMTSNVPQLPSNSTLPLQPLSFEDWYYQIKCAEKNEQKDDENVSSTLAVINTNKEPINSQLPPRDQVNEIITQIEDVPMLASTSSSDQATTVAAAEDTEIHHRFITPIEHIPTPPAAVVTGDNIANIDMASIRHRQSVLLKCIIFVAGILGFILASRLHNLHGEINR